MYTSPILVSLFSVIFFGEKFTKSKTVALIMISIGCALVSGIASGLSFNILGIIMGFMSSISYATYSILTKISSKRKCETVTVSLYSFLFMSVVAVSVCEPLKLLDTLAAKPLPTIPLSIGLGIVTFVLPYFLYAWAMKYLSAGVASALSIVEPMAATVFSVILLSEKLDIYSLCGIVLILTSVYLLGRSE